MQQCGDSQVSRAGKEQKKIPKSVCLQSVCDRCDHDGGSCRCSSSVPRRSRQFQVLWWGGLYQVLCVTCLRCLAAEHLSKSLSRICSFTFAGTLRTVTACSFEHSANKVPWTCTVVSPCHIFPVMSNRCSVACASAHTLLENTSTNLEPGPLPTKQGRGTGAGSCVYQRQ